MTSDHCDSKEELIQLVESAGARTLQVVEDLSDAELEVPPVPTVNPLRWEIGHVSFFYDAMVLSELGRPSLVMPTAVDLFDSFDVHHAERWGLVLPTREGTMDYRTRVRDALVERLESTDRSPRETYLYWLGALHEDMHGEAIAYTRQTLGYAAPAITEAPPVLDIQDIEGDVEIPACTHALGATRDAPFVFDNEKWAHDVEVEAFSISKTAVTNKAFRAFVDDGGYLERRLWSRQGWVWRKRSGRRHPRYWQRTADGWMERHFDRLVPLRDDAAVCYVSWFEAQAYCRWAGRRLPTEVEWEVAAVGTPDGNKRKFPWGDESPTAKHANLDAVHSHTVDVRAYPAGDSAFGCRQMLGNVWEWTDSAFYPFPGYIVDTPYREYSAPWFGYHKVLRGGGFGTRRRLARPGYRNFFLPDRDDVAAGFRTCARRTPASTADPDWHKTARVL